MPLTVMHNNKMNSHYVIKLTNESKKYIIEGVDTPRNALLIALAHNPHSIDIGDDISYWYEIVKRVSKYEYDKADLDKIYAKISYYSGLKDYIEEKDAYYEIQKGAGWYGKKYVVSFIDTPHTKEYSQRLLMLRTTINSLNPKDAVLIFFYWNEVYDFYIKRKLEDTKIPSDEGFYAKVQDRDTKEIFIYELEKRKHGQSIYYDYI